MEILLEMKGNDKMNRKLVIKRAVIWMLSMMITLCSASPVWATEAAPAAAAAENLAETGNGNRGD